MKISRSTTETQKRKQKETQKRNRKNGKYYQGNNKIMNKNKDWLETNDNARDSQKLEKGKEEESQNKIQKESRTK